jgi:hypothetical protein
MEDKYNYEILLESSQRIHAIARNVYDLSCAFSVTGNAQMESHLLAMCIDLHPLADTSQCTNNDIAKSK